jgi:hypothetical protein
MSKTRIRDAFTNDKEQVEILLKEASKAYKVACKLAGVWRNDFMEGESGEERYRSA